MTPAPGDDIRISNSGSITGAIGGSHNTVTTGPVTTTTTTTSGLLADDLETLLAVTRQEQRPDEEVRAVEQALEHAQGGRLDEARQALRSVARSVLGIARSAGTTVLTRELESLLA